METTQTFYFLADTVAEAEQLKNLGRCVGGYFKDMVLVEWDYREQVRPHESVLRNISELILARNTFLHNEVEFLLREELREPRDYYVILRAIAQGKRKLSEIMNDTGFDKAHLSRYLDILRSLGFVEKEVPVTEKSPDKSRLGLYRLHDRFFAFWFKYVLPNRGRLEVR